MWSPRIMGFLPRVMVSIIRHEFVASLDIPVSRDAALRCGNECSSNPGRRFAVASFHPRWLRIEVDLRHGWKSLPAANCADGQTPSSNLDRHSLHLGGSGKDDVSNGFPHTSFAKSLFRGMTARCNQSESLSNRSINTLCYCPCFR
jgi:hypothetical protein